MGDTPKKRRHRSVLSCNDCRRRKLKCDRELPCNRCIKGGIASACAYSALHEPPTKRQRQPPVHLTTCNTRERLQFPADVRTPVDELDNVQSDIAAEDRAQQLERQVAHLIQQLTVQRHATEDETLGSARIPGGDESHRQASSMGLLRGRSYATFYYGSSSAISIMAQFPDLRSFMKDIYQNSTARGLAQGMKDLEGRSHSMRPSYRVVSVPNLRSLLPDRATVDILVQQYLDTFETTYRIVHIPSFETMYGEYWNTKRPADADMDALVLAVLACTVSTSTYDNPRYNHNISAFHGKEVLWIKACEAWLKRHSNKHRTLTSLQVRCLRLLALATTTYKRKEYYQEVQAHMAFMRSSGLHRDPRVFNTQCSTFEGEMRRRLWATSMELELQASVEQGTPSVLSSLEYDCASPRNMNDADLHVDLEQLPQSSSISTFTNTSFLHASMQTIDLRIRLCALTNSLKSSLSFQDTLKYTEAVQQCLQAIPKWTDPRSVQAQTLLDLQLRQFLVILFTAKALRVELVSGHEGRYAMIASLEASVTTIDLHTHVLDIPNLALCLTRNDYYRAALLICHIVYQASKAGDTMIAQVAKLSFDKYIYKALRLQEERALRPGRGSQQHWVLSAAIALVGLQFDPSQAETMKLQAVDRVSRLLSKLLPLQDDPNEQFVASEVLLEDASATATHVNPTSSATTELLSAESFTGAGPRFDAFDIGGTSEWMLDDFWFFNDVPAFEVNNQSHSVF